MLVFRKILTSPPQTSPCPAVDTQATFVVAREADAWGYTDPPASHPNGGVGKDKMHLSRVPLPRAVARNSPNDDIVWDLVVLASPRNAVSDTMRFFPT